VTPAAHAGRPWLDAPLTWIVLVAVYIALGLVASSAVLNWIVGPLFPLLALWVVPRVAHVASRRSGGAEAASR